MNTTKWFVKPPSTASQASSGRENVSLAPILERSSPFGTFLSSILRLKSSASLNPILSSLFRRTNKLTCSSLLRKCSLIFALSSYNRPSQTMIWFVRRIKSLKNLSLTGSHVVVCKLSPTASNSLRSGLRTSSNTTKRSFSKSSNCNQSLKNHLNRDRSQLRSKRPSFGAS
jgi:hypothetical protein